MVDTWAGTRGNQLGGAARSAQHQLAALWGELSGGWWAVRGGGHSTSGLSGKSSRFSGFVHLTDRGGRRHADVRRALEPGTHLPRDCWLWQDLAQR